RAAAGARLDGGRPGRGDARGGGVQRRGQGRRGRPGVRPGAGRARDGECAKARPVSPGHFRRRPASARTRPAYARMLRLRHINPGAGLCFVLFEGVIALSALLAFAEQMSWWGVAVLPLAVAGVVELNDVSAGALRSEGRGVGEAWRGRGWGW